MALDLGLDPKVEAVENSTTAGEMYDAVRALFVAGLKSDRTPFGAAAKLASVPVSIQPGVITKWCGAADSVPTGWLKCEGQAVSKSTYSNLFAKIGTTFGGAGSTFNLPDYRRRVSIGAGGSRPAGSGGPGTALGNTGGAESITLTAGQLARHSHVIDLTLDNTDTWPDDHQHETGQSMETSIYESFRHVVRTWSSIGSATGTLDAAGSHSHTVSGTLDSAGGGTAFGNFSKAVVMTYIIKT